MKLTNKFDLPDAIFQAVANDPYSRGDADYSITGLIKPARIAVLERLHADEIQEDVSDRIFSLLGQAIHGILERSERIAITEQRLYATIDGMRISGQTDRFVVGQGLLQDFKVTSIYKAIGEIDADWVAQQNCYRYLLQVNGYECEKLQIVAILRDWSKRKARTEENYPAAQVVILPVPVWDSADTVAFLKNRIAIHRQALTALPRCSFEDRWATPDTYAVIKPGAKRAIRVYATYDEANGHLLKSDAKLEINFRPGESKRCIDYCLVKNHCTQFQESQR